MRESAQRLTQLAQSLATQDAEWGALVEGTKWLTHLRLVLSAAYRSAHAAAREHAAVLLHCSHGWDRTSQVAALAQLMLDPYYRTFDGFAVLVEKEFCAFGHPFQLRTAHGLDRHARSEEQLAPIFLQFLDATAQLLRQHPALFEFSPRYLLALADGLLDCRFGTFLCNTPKERAGPPVCTPAGSAATASVWTYLAHPAVRARLRNPLYCAAAAGGGGEGGGGGGGHAAATGYAHPQRILDTPLPSLLRRVALWADYWLRWAAKPSYPPEAYAAMRRVRETESRAKGRQTQQPPPGGEGGGGAADVMVPWAWLEEEAERALWAACSGPGLGVMGGEVGGQYEQEEEPLIDFVAPEPAPVAAAEKAVGGAASPAVSVVGTPRQEASEVEEEIDGFVDLVESAGSGALAGEEEAEMASEFME